MCATLTEDLRQLLEDQTAGGYELRISPTTVDKLGVKLYDKVSAVVAELVANSYDADAEHVTVRLPLGVALGSKDRRTGEITEANPPHVIEIEDDGHGMTPAEARAFFLEVGRDRRADGRQGPQSREKGRAVMGRKGIGKLAPFGVCRTIEVISSGGEQAPQGYFTTHFFLDYDRIMGGTRVSDPEAAEPEAEIDDARATDDRVVLEAGEHDGTWRPSRGTTIRLKRFLNKRVPPREDFKRQLERRFALADNDFDVQVVSTLDAAESFEVGPFQVPISPDARIDLRGRPVVLDDGTELPVEGSIGMATEAYRNEEMAGVRIYARGKIIATTRDFEQPAGFTGEFTTRSYLVGEVHADWLDDDDGDDLIRTDRQDILWSSELGEALRRWGAELIKEIGAKTRGPRRDRTRNSFLERSDIESRARARFGDEQVIQTAVDLAGQIGQFAAEDELDDEEYIASLSEVILSVAPHRALMVAFHDFARDVAGQDVKLESLADLFGKTHVAEIASYGQIAHERVRAINELRDALSSPEPNAEDRLHEILAKAPYLIEPTWSVITKNQTLRTVKTVFETEWKRTTGEDVELVVDWENKRPDFVLADVNSKLHIVEIKAPTHRFDNADYERLARYVREFRGFATRHPQIMAQFPEGWEVLLVCDEVRITDADKQDVFERFKEHREVVVVSWGDFLGRASRAHEEFLAARDKAEAANERI